MTNLPAKTTTRECWNCFMVHRGPTETQQRHCPRCAANQDEAPIDVGRELTEEELESRKMWQEVTDVCKVYKNWSKGFRRLIQESGESNYSLVEEFSVEVLEHSFPFLRRLMNQDSFTVEMGQMIRDTVNTCTEEILQECITYEDLMRLGGTWTDAEQDLKEYWLKKIGFTNGLIASSVASKQICFDQKGEE